MFDARFIFDPLSEDQIATIRGVLHPHIVVEAIETLEPAGSASPRPAEDAEVGPDVLRVLDLKQEQLAAAIGSGHRVVLGVAGSGKTVILLARARQLAAQHPENRILLLCFNIPLASALRS